MYIVRPYAVYYLFKKQSMKESTMNATDPIVITSSASESYDSNSDTER